MRQTVHSYTIRMKFAQKGKGNEDSSTKPDMMTAIWHAVTTLTGNINKTLREADLYQKDLTENLQTKLNPRNLQ